MVRMRLAARRVRGAARRSFATATVYEHLVVERVGASGQVLSVVLNRPEVYNAFSTKMALEIDAAFCDVSHSTMSGEKDIRAVVLSGAGKGFCAGADLKERQGLEDAEWMEQHAIFRKCAQSLLSSPVPVIAAVEGAAFGGGFELVLMADWVVAGVGARLAYPEVTRGLFPGLGGMQLLHRASSPSFAKEVRASRVDSPTHSEARPPLDCAGGADRASD
jgi:enoyl-CoA hydratase